MTWLPARVDDPPAHRPDRFGATSPTLCRDCGWPTHLVTTGRGSVFARTWWRHNRRTRGRSSSPSVSPSTVWPDGGAVG